MKVNRPNISAPPSPASTSRSAPTTPTAPASPAQRTPSTSAPASPSTPRGTDALDPSTLRPSARAGASTASIPTPPPPPQPRNTPTAPSGQPPQSVNASLEAELARGRASLKPTDHGVVHPDLQGIRTRRDGQAPHEFADFTRDARVSTHRLMEGQTGQGMLTDINNSTGRLNPGATGGHASPPTAVDIHQSDKMTHSPRLNPNTSGAAQLADVQQAYRFDGQPGAGKASKVNYNPNGGKIDSHDTATQVGDHRANSMGHEMTHAWRASQGVAVAPLEISKHAQHPTLQKYDQPNGQNFPKEVIAQHTLLKEEFETVGLQKTPGRPNAPSENKIRQELGMNPRQDYSGMKPNGQTDQLLKTADQGTDTRWAFQKVEGTPLHKPSDVQKIVSDLEK